MSRAARVMLLGLALTLCGVLVHVFADTDAFLAVHQHYLRPLRRVVGQLLAASWYWSYAVPAIVVMVTAWRALRAPAGARLAVVWKAFALVTLWAIGSFAFFFAIYLAYWPSHGEGGRALLVPSLLACFGYLVLGAGFILSAAKRE